jgi:hypothetical protein
MKKKIDRAYVKWCCVSARPLSMGENDKGFREFLLAATSGRYIAPAKKIAQAELITLAAASQKKVQTELNELLHVDCLDISISGKHKLFRLKYDITFFRVFIRIYTCRGYLV